MVLNRKANVIISLVLMALVLPARATDPTPEQIAQHRNDVRQHNAEYTGTIAVKLREIKERNRLRGLPGGAAWDDDLYVAPASIKAKFRPQTLEEMNRDSRAAELLPPGFRGAFVDSTSTDTWDLLRWVGWRIPGLRRQLLDQAKADGIEGIRFGAVLGDINVNRPESVQPVIDSLNEMWERGISPTLSMLFFPSLDEWKVLDEKGRTDALRSFLLNPDFPKDAGRRARFLFHHIKLAMDKFNAENEKRPATERRPRATVGINGVNEAETFVAFQNFWQESLHRWGSPNWMSFYVPASITVGLASVEVRLATYSVFGEQRILQIENPALTDPHYPSHQGDLQYYVIKLILGNDDLMKADFDQLRKESLDTLKDRVDAQRAAHHINAIDAAILKYVDCPVNQPRWNEARDEIIAKLEALCDEHLRYQKISGKTAADDTMLMFDYYQQSEFVLPKSVNELVHELSANHGAKLKAGWEIGTDEGFLNFLRERTQEAEKFTDQKLWHDDKSVNEIDFETLLSQEDAIVLDKLIGLRNEWGLKDDAVFRERRERARWKMSEFDNFKDGPDAIPSDEKRDDMFLSRLLANNARVLKRALAVKTMKEVREKLREAGRDGADVIEIADREPLRAILNRNERTILHRLFGFVRKRRTGFLPPHWAVQVRLGLRQGFANMAIEAMNELGIRVIGIAEWGTPYPWVLLTERQLRTDLFLVAHKGNAYIGSSHGGSLVSPIGWMGGPVTGTIVTNRKRAADGIYQIIRKAPKEFEYRLNRWEKGTPHFILYRDELNRELETYRGLVKARSAVKSSGAHLTCSELLNR